MFVINAGKYYICKNNSHLKSKIFAKYFTADLHHTYCWGRLISHPVELVGDVIEQHKEITGNRNSGDTFAALLRWGKLHQEHRWYYHHHQSTRKTTHNCPTTKGTFWRAAMVIQIPTIIWKFPLNLKCPHVFRGDHSTLKWSLNVSTNIAGFGKIFTSFTVPWTSSSQMTLSVVGLLRLSCKIMQRT